MLEWWLKMKNARSETHMLHVFADTDDAGVGVDDKRRKGISCSGSREDRLQTCSLVPDTQAMRNEYSLHQNQDRLHQSLRSWCLQTVRHTCAAWA